jgi:hypothetical protein
MYRETKMDLALDILRRTDRSNPADVSYTYDAGSYSIENSDSDQDITALNSVVLTFAQGVPVTTMVRVSLLIALLALSALSLSRKR